MKTRILQVDRERPEPAVIEEAAQALRDGKLVVFPTETVYGLGAHALDPIAVQKIFDAKERASVAHGTPASASARISMPISCGVSSGPLIGVIISPRVWIGVVSNPWRGPKYA